MSFYLRVEAVNLSHFIMDTNDLSTIRGGSLLLLEAMEIVDKIVIANQPIQQGSRENELSDLNDSLKKLKNSKQTNTTKRKIRDIEQSIESLKNPDLISVTKGASWGLFNLNMPIEQAQIIKNKVVNFFNRNPRYKHATFVVDLHPNNGDHHYQKDRDSLQTLNRWQQMQAPSLAICKQGTECCAVDKVRPATTRRSLKNQEYDYVSLSVSQRRKYGLAKKRTFYKHFTDIKETYTQDFDELSKSKNYGNLNGKIAFIYFDGNGFGDIQRNSKNSLAQYQFDQDTRHGREKVFAEILNKIRQQPEAWQTHEYKIRLETLLWGGDEIIWVVPAWKGWWMVNEFYTQAKLHIQHNGKPLFHACGLVFCHHNAPVHRIDALARNLADQFAKANRAENLIAYQVLESFDHAGMQLKNYRNSRVCNLGALDQLVINAEQMEAIRTGISKLKNDPDFAKRKVYQILQAYRSGNTAKAEEYYDKLEDAAKTILETLRAQFGAGQIHWLHIMDLWDYID